MGIKPLEFLQSKLSKNLLWLYSRTFLSYLLRFLFLVFVIKLISPHEYGIFASVNAWVSGIVSIFSFGLGTAIIRLTPVYDKSAPEKIKGLLWFVLKYGIIMSIILSIGLTISYLLKLLPDISGFLVFLILGIFLYFPFNFLANIIYGLQKMGLLTVLDSLTNMFKIIFALIFFHLGFGYVGIIYGFFLSLFLMILAKLYFLRKFIGRKSVDLKNLISHSVSGYSIDLFVIASSHGRIIISGLVLDLSSTGIMALASSISAYVSTILGTINAAAFPIVARGDNPKRIIKTSFIIMILFSIPILVVTAFLSKPIIMFLAESYFPVTNYLLFFVLGEILYTLANTSLNQLYAVGKHIIIRKLYLLLIPIVLLFNLVFIKSLGILGAAFSHIAYSTIILFLGLYNLRKYFIEKS